jgi:hypothetical protein
VSSGRERLATWWRKPYDRRNGIYLPPAFGWRGGSIHATRSWCTFSLFRNDFLKVNGYDDVPSAGARGRTCGRGCSSGYRGRSISQEALQYTVTTRTTASHDVESVERWRNTRETSAPTGVAEARTPAR